MTVASGPRTDRDVRTAPDEDHEEVDRESTPDPPGERRRFPSAFTVLAAVTIAVWVLAFIVPTGQYSTDSETGRPIAGTYERIDVDLGFNDRLYDPFMAPVNGLYGIESSETGLIGPYEAGALFRAPGVFRFVPAVRVFSSEGLLLWKECVCK